MPRKFFVYLFLFSIVFAFSCNKQISNVTEDVPIQVTPVGDENSLEIATWNIEQFPKHRNTVKDLRQLITDLDIDVFAVQEITNVDSFTALVNSLPDYDGRVGSAASSYNLWPGVIYKTDLVTLVSEEYLFTGEYNFPRAPYSLYLRARKNNEVFDFHLIILHLKAFGDEESENRRRGAIRTLESYLEAQLANPANDPDYIVAGDWNDLLNDRLEDNVFLPFLEDTVDYMFLTESLLDDPDGFSFIGNSNFRSLIDHIMVSGSIFSAYPSIETRVIKLDEEFPPYLLEVSDHRPVTGKIPVF